MSWSALPPVKQEARRRARPMRVLVRMVAGLTVAALSLTVVLAATRPKVRVIAPSPTGCVGDPIWVGAKAKGSTKVKVKVTVSGPDGAVALNVKKRVGKKWRRWSTTAQLPGTYRTTYKSKPKKWTFLTNVIECGGGGPAPGSVSISDNDAGSSMFGMTNLAPGVGQASCITATYGGSLPATVRLYGATSGTGLDAFILMTVTRGTSAGFGSSCSGFQPDATNYTGAGPGVIYVGTMAGWADDYGSGLVDPTAAAPEQWTAGESHAYRFEILLPAAVPDAAQGLTAGQSFVWEARD